MRYLHYLGILALVLTVQVAAQDTGSGADVDMDRIISMDEAGNTTSALEALDNLLVDDPENLEALYYQGLLKLQQDDTDGARDAFLKIAELYPQVPEARNNLALIYAREGEYERARSMLLSATGLDPQYATAKANLGDLYLRMAMEAYQDAGSLYRDNPGANDAMEANQAKLEYLEQLFQNP